MASMGEGNSKTSVKGERMRKPKMLAFKGFSNVAYILEDQAVDINMPVYFKEIPKLIKWLEQVQKYHEFKGKKKTTNRKRTV